MNDAPVAVTDTATVLEDAETISIDVLANDTDEEGDPLTLLSVTTSGTGTVTINGGLLEYTPVALTRNKVSKVLNVTVQTLNNGRREEILILLKIGGRVL